jgi:MoCo/4Fe-4S cofactor protein with predicted Tat translocation signal
MSSMTPPEMPSRGRSQFVRISSLTDNGQARKPDVQRYWRSLEQLADTPEFREKLEHQPALGAEEALHASRRRFLQTMGASLSLAGLAGTGCIRLPEEKLAPYAHRPENRMPGVPVSYATAMEIGGVAQGLLVTSFDGRPTKIEGNPIHPLNGAANHGAADILAQASVLELYDPDRSFGVVRHGTGEASAWATGKEPTWDDFGKWAKEHFKGDGEDICILSEASGSPSLAALRSKFEKQFPKAQWYEYEALSDDNAREGTFAAFGQHMLPVLELAEAKVVVSLDADLFGGGAPLAIKYARDFAHGRRLYDEDKNAQTEMNRLYVIESLHTITGASADHRMACRPGEIAAIAAELAAALGVGGSDAPRALSEHTASTGQSPQESKLSSLLASIKSDLESKSNAGCSVVVAGPRQPAEVHALVAAINFKLGNVGKTVVYYPDPQPKRPPHAAAIEALVKRMESGAVKTLLILGGNPVYDAPADLKFGEALKKVRESAHLAVHEDETSKLCSWHLSRAHYLESWGDARTYNGIVSIVQPLIEPLFDGKSPIEVLSLLVDDKPEKGYDIVRETVRSLVGKTFTEYRWKKLLAEGVIDGTEARTVMPAKLAEGAVKAASASSPAAGEYDVVFYADKVYDGRFANNGWLQELPDPMTRLTWDNAAVMSEKTAAKIGAKQDEMIELTAEGAAILAPVYFLPSMPEGVIGLALGYGRSVAGHIGKDVGQNAFLLRTIAASGWRSVKARATGKPHRLATVQDHHIVDHYGKEAVQDRIRKDGELLREVPLEKAYTGRPETHSMSIFDSHRFDGAVGAKGDSAPGAADKNGVPKHDLHKWGMSVDLTACTGCGACVVACQAENNIPIVGKEQVLHGREMHWIRIDRYFRGEPENAVAIHQPVLCMQCENAPCESVCPVAATTHSQEGLNMMTYNRCVGTRYCSNNCPYKVRRFNFFDYNRGTLADDYVPDMLRTPVTELIKMQKNPDVTVRMRGIMEKCTYCIQRIEQGRIAAKREGDRPIRDGEIQTACQQTCPTQAIVFGDLNQNGHTPDGRGESPVSDVFRLQSLARSYGMLDAELNTRPRTQYLARVRNKPNEMTESE